MYFSLYAYSLNDVLDLTNWIGFFPVSARDSRINLPVNYTNAYLSDVLWPIGNEDCTFKFFCHLTFSADQQNAACTAMAK
jgi:hypothetical protein